MVEQNKKIGIFDSGLGGLCILRALEKSLPSYNYLYLADSAFAPYGERTHADIFNRTEKIVLFLRAQNCALVIIACNSASSEALRQIQARYNTDTFRVLGILIPTAEAAAEIPDNRNIGILATRATVTSDSYLREVLKVLPDAVVTQQIVPLIAQLIESDAPTAEIEKVLDDCVPPLLEKDVTSIILGCTHYELILPLFEKRIPSHIPLITTGAVIGEKLTTYLARHTEINNQLSWAGAQDFFTTGDAGLFYASARKYIAIHNLPKQITL